MRVQSKRYKRSREASTGIEALRSKEAVGRC